MSDLTVVDVSSPEAVECLLEQAMDKRWVAGGWWRGGGGVDERMCEREGNGAGGAGWHMARAIVSIMVQRTRWPVTLVPGAACSLLLQPQAPSALLSAVRCHHSAALPLCALPSLSLCAAPSAAPR